MDEISVVMTKFQAALNAAVASEVRRQVTEMIGTGEMPLVPAVPVKQRGPEKGSKAQAKPCPVTGVLNTHRRFSYLMPEVRTPGNLKKFKRGGK